MKVTDDSLIAQYNQLHSSRKYGKASAHSALKTIDACLAELNPGTLLEYGCGQSQLHEHLGRPGMVWDRYDPAIPERATIPRESYDFVFSTDVLEHIPTENVPDVIEHLRQLSPTVFLRISTRLARTILPDGRNAHLTVWTGKQWLDAVKVRFPEASLIYELPGEKCIIVTWKSSSSDRIAALEAARDKQRRGGFRQFFKGIERSLRSARDSVFGKKEKRKR
jgi:hypothetical protein